MWNWDKLFQYVKPTHRIMHGIKMPLEAGRQYLKNEQYTQDSLSLTWHCYLKKICISSMIVSSELSELSD